MAHIEPKVRVMKDRNREVSIGSNNNNKKEEIFNTQ
jgi:hypothetical protein